MPPTTLLILMSCFLAYCVFRAVVYFKTKRPQFGIAVVFVAAVVTFEIVRLIMKMVSGQA